MQVISEYLETPVKYEYDVLVAGGGIAGIAAALAAARQGAKTVLLEKQFMLGGLATAGLITIYLPLCDGRGTQVSFGIAEELLRLSILHGYETEDDYPKPWLENGTPEEKAETRFRVQYNPQLFAIEAERLLKKEGVDILYVTDVQVGNAKAASFPNGNFMAISGTEWKRNEEGQVVLDENGLPTLGTNDKLEIGNREPKFQGGWNNTITYKDWTLNFLWDFRVGGHVYNGTQYAMTIAGTSKLSENRERIEVSGVNTNGEFVTNVFKADKTYTYNGIETSGKTIIAGYYQDIYPNDSKNFMTEVNALRLRSLSLSYNLPKAWLVKTGVIKRASVTASANNLLLFTNYNGDPEVAAAGSGAVGSSSVGIDYCGVPATGSFSFGVNLTF